MAGRSQMSVTGADGDTIYTVEFDENAPNGACNCPDFMTDARKNGTKQVE
jgi:hypothetical protein